MDMQTALALLTDALDGCRNEDMRTPNVFAARDFLAASATVKWPFEQFREELLNDTGSELWEVASPKSQTGAAEIRRYASRQANEDISVVVVGISLAFL